MLPPFIIEQIRKREERQSQEERPVLELPLHDHRGEPPRGVSSPQDEAKPERGVIIIDL